MWNFLPGPLLCPGCRPNTNNNTQLYRLHPEQLYRLLPKTHSKQELYTGKKRNFQWEEIIPSILRKQNISDAFSLL